MSELLDVDFRDLVLPPAATFESGLILRGGYSSKEAEVQVQQMLRFAADTYTHFGGGAEDQLPLGMADSLGTSILYEDVLDYVLDYENQTKFMVYGFEEEIATLAHRYLVGEGEDYDRFYEIMQLN